ncbi:MAG TPA: peptidase M48 [Cyanobacteria bacterium UBA8803]|nr:peptidase M48 [Cyanobacteria bacterium UBA9273]HBL62666.1 peptidase M48 [Cyanobacteria bacterium UBA8803]
MKLLWNSLLITLGILLPISTSTVLAKSLEASASVELMANSEEVLLTSDRADPVVVQETLSIENSPKIAIPDIDGETFPEVIASDNSPETPRTVVIPDAVPVSTPSSASDRETDTVKNEETSTVPSSPDSADRSEAGETTENEETPTAPSNEVPATETQPTENTETTPSPSSEESTAPETPELTPELTPEELARQEKLIEADRLYMSGQFLEAQQLYRQAKAPFTTEAEVQEQPAAIYDPAQLSPAGAVYWRQAQAGFEQQLETKTLLPLKFLVEQQPQFIPGHLRYAEALKQYGQQEESLRILERATTLYPNDPELLKAKITALAEAERWLEASLAARQFALFNPTDAGAQEFEALADENLERYKSHLRSELRGNAIANVITGALGYIFTGNLFGPISAIETTVLMLRGEAAVGEKIAEQVQEELPMLEDEEVLEYVREVGNKLAIVAGRKEFEYQFYVIMDDRINAFALPGGKVFVNAGAILKTKSEAELAGLLAHELAHAVLSHGFQLVTQGNLIANVTQYIPFGGTATNLIVLDYSRDMERQADELGTRILVASGYAADGLHNLMVTLSQEEKDRPLFAWLSTHPDTKERISNLETQIDRNGYNRYTYEGVARHVAMQKRVAQLLKEYKERENCEENQDCPENQEENEQ